ncbi:ferric reductase-like transmembrane domain-containing protein [Rhodobacteraceae bacterium N5(2021)]|uniref:Ferric reductase-like transmembrane domain-containing protein n=1 Tax=Gymnodinialimonas phycosphaerae TaxID=2841589 RepID=A0A975TSF2_9RHOB|nr:ferric reductase-like transmembrane domain-containing protein [Gymnodinialimonas phycosphaerae]MBY4893586.1 ferric reductase-like transmembrane domain-containing protein [Gymnodinialimonas phycosphaerae]
MKLTVQRATILAALAIFVGLPVLFYALGDAPRRTLLKEAISISTLFAFAAMLGQFFMARSNTWLLSVFKPPQIQKVHKYIAYTAVAVILAHPALIVLPRALEGGVRPWDALVTMITTFDSIGVGLGLAAWVALLVLTVTAFFRKPIIKRLSTHYRGWRYLHGGLATGFTALALWHAIKLGRHTNIAMSLLFLALAVTGFGMLAKLYWAARPRPHKSIQKQPAS